LFYYCLRTEFQEVANWCQLQQWAAHGSEWIRAEMSLWSLLPLETQWSFSSRAVWRRSTRQ